MNVFVKGDPGLPSLPAGAPRLGRSGSQVLGFQNQLCYPGYVIWAKPLSSLSPSDPTQLPT
jgi:hypothetical protein